MRARECRPRDLPESRRRGSTMSTSRAFEPVGRYPPLGQMRRENLRRPDLAVAGDKLQRIARMSLAAASWRAARRGCPRSRARALLANAAATPTDSKLVRSSRHDAGATPRARRDTIRMRDASQLDRAARARSSRPHRRYDDDAPAARCRSATMSATRAKAPASARLLPPNLCTTHRRHHRDPTRRRDWSERSPRNGRTRNRRVAHRGVVGERGEDDRGLLHVLGLHALHRVHVRVMDAHVVVRVLLHRIEARHALGDEAQVIRVADAAR